MICVFLISKYGNINNLLIHLISILFKEALSNIPFHKNNYLYIIENVEFKKNKTTS